jgi:hypothetical protein
VARAFCVFWPRRRVSTHRRITFQNGYLTNIICESKGRSTIRDDACSHDPAAKNRRNARATAYTRLDSVRSPPQTAPNVQRACNRALIAWRRGGRFPHSLRVGKCVPVQKLTGQVRGAGQDASGAKRGRFPDIYFLGQKTIYRKRSI